MFSIYIAECTVVRSPALIRQMSLAGFNDIILKPCMCAICWLTVGDLTRSHIVIHLTVHVYSISFFLSLPENHFMVIKLGACNFYCVLLVTRLNRMYYCKCRVTINCIILSWGKHDIFPIMNEWVVISNVNYWNNLPLFGQQLKSWTIIISSWIIYATYNLVIINNTRCSTSRLDHIITFKPNFGSRPNVFMVSLLVTTFS